MSGWVIKLLYDFVGVSLVSSVMKVTGWGLWPPESEGKEPGGEVE